jgi:phosphoribosylformylglycinamidine (FGAM) synthase PurS component
MASRFEVAFKPGVRDGPGESVKKQIQALGLTADSVRSVQIFTVDKDLSPEQQDILCQELFADPIVQDVVVNNPIETDGFNWLIEVTKKPGVQDTVGKTAAHWSSSQKSMSTPPSSTG